MGAARLDFFPRENRMGTGRDQDIRRRPPKRRGTAGPESPERDLKRIKFEADQKIASAKVEAESLRLQKGNVTPEGIFVPFDSQFFPDTEGLQKDESALCIYME